MSTYSNQPQQNNWELWFLTSLIIFLGMLFWGIIADNSEQLPVIYDGILLATFVNLIHCIYVGFKK